MKPPIRSLLFVFAFVLFVSGVKAQADEMCREFQKLRFRLGLVWFATVAAMVGYMLLVGSVDTNWFDSTHTTPILTQAITLCSLASTGIVLGQLVRAPRRMADAFMERVEQVQNGDRA